MSDAASADPSRKKRKQLQSSKKKASAVIDQYLKDSSLMVSKFDLHQNTRNEGLLEDRED